METVLRGTGSAAVGMALLLVVPRVSAGAEPPPADPFAHHQFALNEADPVSSVPSEENRNAHPLQFGYFLQDLLDHGQVAVKAGNTTAALRYYQAVSKAVPDRAVGFSRLGQLLEKTNQPAAAIVACRTAIGLLGVTVDDYTRFVRLVVGAPGALAPHDAVDVKAVIAHLRAQSEVNKTLPDELQCELATRQGDTASLETCTAALAAAAPNDARTISYQWALAIQKGDSGEARQIIRKAIDSGMAPGAVKLMTEQTDARFWRWSQRFRDWQFSAPLLVAVLAAAASVIAVARRRRLARQNAVQT
ncbi:MAG TPA: hypothetical protein VH374_19940 [Polyangia bacterium]|nr:hypothetical protein [Polyangia bacterium]